MRDPYAEWDGAYVMGALSRTERAEYEAHLATCASCTAAVAELGPLPGLLGRLSPQDAELLLTPVAETDATPPAGMTERSVALARSEVVVLPWWRRRTTLLIAAAAVIIAAAGVTVPVVRAHQGPPVAESATVVLHRTIPSPLSASVTLTSVRWGTRIDMRCSYAGTYGDGPERDYALYVVDAAGHATAVSRWHAGPGEVSQTAGSSELAAADIQQVQIRPANGTVLLSART
jgi:hypothetical protein